MLVGVGKKKKTPTHWVMGDWVSLQMTSGALQMKYIYSGVWFSDDFHQQKTDTFYALLFEP